MGKQCVTLPINNRYIVNKTVGKLVLKFQVTPTRSANETQVIIVVTVVHCVLKDLIKIPSVQTESLLFFLVRLDLCLSLLHQFLKRQTKHERRWQ